MAFLGTLDIAGSALTAQRFRTDIILQNLANAETTRTQNGDPYKRKQVVFEERTLDFKEILRQQGTAAGGAGGVRVKTVVESDNDFIPVYDPDHPHANEDGYVMMPNVNRTEEQIDLMAASNAYNANLTALSVVKAMTMKALEIGK